jgi:hypothetical protein
MNNILRTLILASIIYAPGLCAAQQRLSVVQKNFNALLQRKEQQQPTLTELNRLRESALKLAKTNKNNPKAQALKQQIVEFYNKRIGTLSGPSTDKMSESTPTEKANQAFLHAQERVKKAQAGQLSGLANEEWEAYENGLGNVQEKQKTKEYRINLFKNSFENFKKIKISMPKTDLAEASKDYQQQADYFAKRYSDDQNVQVLCNVINNELRVATAAPSQANANVPEVNTSLAPVTSSTAPSTSSVAPANQAQSAAAQKDVVSGEHVEAIPLTAEQRAEEVAKVAAQATAQAQATVTAHAHAPSSTAPTTSSVSTTVSSKPAVAPIPTRSAVQHHSELRNNRKASLSWLKKLGFGALAGGTVYVLYALINVYAGTTKSMIGYNSLSWFGRKLWLI